MKVPDRPGIDVELDEDELKKYHELFKREGAYTNYLDPFRPDWKPQLREFHWEEFPIDERNIRLGLRCQGNADT